MKLFSGFIINILSLMVVSYLVPGFYFADMRALLVSGVVIGVVNTFIKPVLHIIALPLSLLTLGLFAFLINVSLLWFVAEVVPGFEIRNFLTAIISSIVLALISAFFHKMDK